MAKSVDASVKLPTSGNNRGFCAASGLHLELCLQ